jgi:hypothetical protein
MITQPPAHPRFGFPASLTRPALLWRVAHLEASLAYADWCREPGRHAYAVYRAVQDRADRAHDELAASALRA